MKKCFLAGLMILLVCVLSGCEDKSPYFDNVCDTLTIEVEDDSFSLLMLSNYIFAYTYEDKEIPFRNMEITGDYDLYTIGDYPLTISVTDNKKTVSTVVTLHVADTKAPKIHVVDKEIKLFKKTTFEETPVTNLLFAYDEHEGNITEKISWEGEVNPKKVGTYDITYSVSDESGNTDSVVITYKVTETRDEFLHYLYDRTIDFYWGKYFITDKNGKILNYDDALYYAFTNAGTDQFERSCGIQENTDGVETGVLLEKREDGIYLLDEKDVYVNNYESVDFFVTSETSKLIHYRAEVLYTVSAKKKLMLEHSFTMKKVGGKFYVEDFTLPNS